MTRETLSTNAIAWKPPSARFWVLRRRCRRCAGGEDVRASSTVCCVDLLIFQRGLFVVCLRVRHPQSRWESLDWMNEPESFSRNRLLSTRKGQAGSGSSQGSSMELVMYCNLFWVSVEIPLIVFAWILRVLCSFTLLELRVVARVFAMNAVLTHHFYFQTLT